MERDRYKEALSRNLREIRKAKGLTTVDLAKILGVSQAKVSYIEHCKGVLSAEDVAILSKRLSVPIADFYRGLEDSEDPTGTNELVGQLVRYGAVLLAKPRGLKLEPLPFEEVFASSLGFIEDDRLHKGFCAALITQASRAEINVDQIFSIIGNNPFLMKKALDEARLCINIVELLATKGEHFRPRTKIQLGQIVSMAHFFTYNPLTQNAEPKPQNELSDLADFVADCLHAQK